MIDRPSLKRHAITVATDLKTDHARSKCLMQHLGVARVKAEICDNQRIRTIVTINSREGARTCAPVEFLRQFSGFHDPKQPRFYRTISADHSCRTIAATPHIVRDDQRSETGPGVRVVPSED